MKKMTFQALFNITLIALMVVGSVCTVSAQKLNRTKLNQTTRLKTAPAVKLKAATATSASEKELAQKCADCKRYKDAKNMEAYAAADCRATNELCAEVNRVGGGGTGPIIIGSTDTMAAESTSASNRNAEMMYYEQFSNVIIMLDDLKKTHQNVSTTVEVFGQDKKLIYSSAKKSMKHYTFNKRSNKLMSLKGVTHVKTLSPTQKNVLMVPVKLKKLKPQKGLVKVTVKALHPKTRKMVSIKTFGKNVYLK